MCGGVDEGARCEGKGKKAEKEIGEQWGRNGGSGGVLRKAGKGVNKKGMSSDFPVQHRVD
jgi:hypothetical protein